MRAGRHSLLFPLGPEETPIYGWHCHGIPFSQMKVQRLRAVAVSGGRWDGSSVPQPRLQKISERWTELPRHGKDTVRELTRSWLS